MIRRTALRCAVALAASMGFVAVPLAVGAPAMAAAGVTIPASVNALDPDTATLENSVGKWVPWYSATAVRASEAAHTGTAGLRIGVTAPFGWGVTASDWPGFPVDPGAEAVSFWSRSGSLGSRGAVVTMTVHWKTADGTDLLATALESPPLTDCWQRAETAVVVPDQTATVFVTLTGVGRAGDVIFVDDLAVR